MKALDLANSLSGAFNDGFGAQGQGTSSEGADDGSEDSES